MNKRTFNKLCTKLFKNKEFLPNDEKHKMLLHIVKYRKPVHKCLITFNIDWDWLYAMGYLYKDEKFIKCGDNL